MWFTCSSVVSLSSLAPAPPGHRMRTFESPSMTWRSSLASGVSAAVSSSPTLPTCPSPSPKVGKVSASECVVAYKDSNV